MATLAEGPGENAVGEQDWPRASGLCGMAYAAWPLGSAGACG